MLQPDLTVLRDVELRLKALEEVRRLRPLVASLRDQLQAAKQEAARADQGSSLELQHLQEAAEASERLATFRDALLQAERELRRTHYLLSLLSE